MRARCGLLVVAIGLAACTEMRRPLGEDCLKDQDCVSGICSGLKCSATPPLVEAGPTPDAAVDAPQDAPQDTTTDAPVDAGAQG
jgi:hypothetical protein